MYIKVIGFISIFICGINSGFPWENGITQIANGQIAPDNSLGKERSQVKTNHQIQEITGGARRGNNLFHSFKDFSLPEGSRAYFIPQGKIANIFSRVTGKNISHIQGILGVRGSANLFLLNPNGILKGRQ